MTRIPDGLWQRVTDNRALLDACPRHEFLSSPVTLGMKCKCVICGGEIGLTGIADYIRGYEAAGKSADDIWPGWHGR
jgi:hypothetical protein